MFLEINICLARIPIKIDFVHTYSVVTVEEVCNIVNRSALSQFSILSQFNILNSRPDPPSPLEKGGPEME